MNFCLYNQNFIKSYDRLVLLFENVERGRIGRVGISDGNSNYVYIARAERQRIVQVFPLFSALNSYYTAYFR